MILIWLLVILMTGGLLAWLFSLRSQLLARWTALIALFIDFMLVLNIWFQGNVTGFNDWIENVKIPWIESFGISFHLAMDGLSLLMVLLTVFLGILSVLTSWKEITDRIGFFHFNLMWILAGIIGVFLAMDLFLFYFFWEVMLIPMYFLIGIWGHENRIYAAIKFFIFTQASGLLMLLAILGLYFVHQGQTGIYSFDYFDLLGTTINPAIAKWLMFGFLIAFIVKLPAVPVHNWLPDAHTEAPTAGSVILAGLLLKTGAYGLLRFVLPLFPQASIDFAPWGMFLGVLGILYGAKLAFAQTDLKRLVAYTSVSHMGFVMLGVFAFNELALQGVVVQMIAHGLSTGALFILVGELYERIHTRDLDRLGGLWEKVPRMGGVGMFFALASLGLPGLANFVAEFLTLLGTFQANIIAAIFASLGLVAATIYSLRIVQRVFHGNQLEEWTLPDLNIRESIIMGSMIIILVWIGLYPQNVINTAKSTLNKVEQRIESVRKPSVLSQHNSNPQFMNDNTKTEQER